MLYYQILNELASERLGDPHSAKCLIYSVDFGEIKRLQKESRWDLLNDLVADAAESLQNGGANLILICANTMHLTIDAVRDRVQIPVIHIAEVTAQKIVEKKLKTIALLGTKYTMEKDFYKDVLTSFRIKTIIPSTDDRDEIHRVIYEELSKGTFLPTSKKNYLEIIERLREQGAEGIVLGCTEIPLLIQQEDVTVPIFDTTTIHATKAMDMALV